MLRLESQRRHIQLDLNRSTCNQRAVFAMLSKARGCKVMRLKGRVMKEQGIPVGTLAGHDHNVAIQVVIEQGSVWISGSLEQREQGEERKALR